MTVGEWYIRWFNRTLDEHAMGELMALLKEGGKHG